MGIAPRILQRVVVIAAVITLVFVLTHLVGDPVRLMLPLDATAEQYAALQRSLGLDKPILDQYLDYLSGLVRGDFGESLWQHEPAFGLAVDALWRTLVLGSAALALGAVTGTLAGFAAALRRESFLDRLIGAVSILGVSIPAFWLALLLINLCAVQLSLLPTSGYSVEALILPMICTAAYVAGHVMQIARAALIEELGRPYIVTARAKGLSTREVVFNHAMRNALIPIVTVAGLEASAIVAGSLVVIEAIFAWPGIGYLTYEALTRHDYPLIQACVLLIALMVIVINLLVDLLNAVSDPRARTAG